MGTEIKTWQIINGALHPIEVNLKNVGRTEPYDLEPWLASNPSIIEDDIAIIGRQVISKSGPIDLLGIDRSGNLLIIELKRDKLPREALAQAIDYASDVKDWDVEKLNEICTNYKGKNLEEIFKELFPDVDIENLDINDLQRIVLVGFSVESSLERMIKWLSDIYNVNINAIVLNYIKTSAGDELLAKTSIISEESEKERVNKHKIKTRAQEDYLKFYQELVHNIKERIHITLHEAHPSSIYQIPTGIGGVHFEWAFHGRPRSSFGVELHFEKGKKDTNRNLLSEMEKLKDQIEKETGEKVVFQGDWGETWARLYIKRDEGEITDELKKWAIEKMAILYKLLQPRLEKLK